MMSLKPIVKPNYISNANFFSYMLNNKIPIPNTANANTARYARVHKSGNTPYTTASLKQVIAEYRGFNVNMI